MLLHADGFDHYGTTGDAPTNALLIGDGYTVASNLYVFGPLVVGGKAYNPSPGLGWLYFNRIDRCFFSRPVSVANQHWAQFRTTFTAVPDYPSFAFSFMDGAAFASGHIAWVAFLPDLSITIGMGNVNTFDGSAAGGTIFAKLPNAYHLQTAQCWEIVYTANTNAIAPYNGSIALYLEGQLQAQVLGLPLTVPLAHCVGSQPITGGSCNCFFRDYIVGDTTGAYNNTPMGPRRVGTKVASAVGGLNAWAVTGAANAAAATNSIPPDITKFIEGDNVGDITELTFAASPLSITGVSGVLIKSYLQKTSISACSVKLGIRSAAIIVNSPDINPGIGFAFWNTPFFETDPNTGLPGFSKAAYDALAMRVTRSV